MTQTGSTLVVEFEIDFVAETVCAPGSAASCSFGGGVAADTYVRTVVNSASFATAVDTYLSVNAPSAAMRSAAVVASATPNAYNQLSYRSVSPTPGPTGQPSGQPSSAPSSSPTISVVDAKDVSAAVIGLEHQGYFIYGAMAAIVVFFAMYMIHKFNKKDTEVFMKSVRIAPSDQPFAPNIKVAPLPPFVPANADLLDQLAEERETQNVDIRPAESSVVPISAYKPVTSLPNTIPRVIGTHVAEYEGDVHGLTLGEV